MYYWNADRLYRNNYWDVAYALIHKRMTIAGWFW